MSQMNSKLVPFTLTIKIKLAFKLQQFLKQNELCFVTPSDFNCELITTTYLLVLSREGGLEAGGGGARHLFVCECKKGPY